MDNNGKVCPLVRQACLKDQCEFFNGMIKRCEISALSYNTYRLAESLKGNSVPKDQSRSTFGNRNKPVDSPSGMPF
jgi:hypothetical protein